MRDSRADRLGFHLEGGGAHTSRTIMLAELTDLLASVTDLDAPQRSYRRAVEDDNCLGKRSRMTRSLTFKHLAQLYALDPDILLFRALRCFWSRDAAAQPLLALLCAYARDPLLRASAPLVLGAREGAPIARPQMEALLERRFGARFSPVTLTSSSQNLLASWVKSGHLSGVKWKMRSRAKATPGSAGYALLLAHLRGERGRVIEPSIFLAKVLRRLLRPRAVVSISGELPLPVACSRKTPPSIEQDASSTLSEEYGKPVSQSAERYRCA
ncbi:MAG: hypothetical protein NTU62_00820 [Spirochaetes bacterium]|nr:hypothetical protein [Spirochaetota bacterium]